MTKRKIQVILVFWAAFLCVSHFIYLSDGIEVSRHEGALHPVFYTLLGGLILIIGAIFYGLFYSAVGLLGLWIAVSHKFKLLFFSLGWLIAYEVNTIYIVWDSNRGAFPSNVVYQPISASNILIALLIIAGISQYLLYYFLANHITSKSNWTATPPDV